MPPPVLAEVALDDEGPPGRADPHDKGSTATGEGIAQHLETLADEPRGARSVSSSRSGFGDGEVTVTGVTVPDREPRSRLHGTPDGPSHIPLIRGIQNFWHKFGETRYIRPWVDYCHTCNTPPAGTHPPIRTSLEGVRPARAGGLLRNFRPRMP